MPQANVWYCGHCRHGPHNCTIDANCVKCGRRIDQYATYEVATSRATASPAQQNGYSTRTRQSPAAPSGVYSSYPYSSSSSGYVSMQPSHTPNATNAHHAAPSYSSYPSGPVPTNFGPRVNWYCCNCGDGPKTIATESMCVGCHHRRCSYCKTA